VHLKQLNLLGFKSFAHKTSLNFASGMTAIVGPNGCGKTNILDALRWVLGEQKVSLLRGSRMEEVIFNGTKDAKPLGMAEVTLRLVNDRGILPTEYNELQITRRLFRSGESEYLLNKVPCRRKDITELFYDTGMGAHSYSVIQQDMIEAVISDKAEERRFLFEEAAGITKYKQRKRAALRKLEATENDFLRLNDIFAEVQTRVRSLKRQYHKAERYQKIQDDVKGWELYLGSQRVKAIEQQRRELQAELDRLADATSQKQAQLDRISARLENDRRRQVDLERQLSEVSNRVFEITEAAHEQETQISVLVEKRSNARQLIDRNTEDIRALETRLGLLAEQVSEVEGKLQSYQQEQAALAAQLTEAERAQARADERLLAARHARETENRRLAELEGQLLSGKSEEDHLQEQEQELTGSLADIRVQLEQIDADVLEAAEAARKHAAELADLASQRDTARQRRDELQEQLEDLASEGLETTERIARVTASVEACEARRKLLEDMIVQYEGFGSGVVAVMEQQGQWPGVTGTVADAFVPVDGLERALEAALGEMAGFLICRDRRSAEEVIEFIRREKKGRIGILLPDSGTISAVVHRPQLDGEAFVGWMDQFVTTDTGLRALMEAVLSRVAVFKAGADPTPILQKLPFGFKAVSTEGQVYSQNLMAGGSDDTFPLFRRRERIKEQETLLADLTEELELAREHRKELERQTVTARSEVSAIAEQIDELTGRCSQAEQLLRETEYQQRSLAASQERLVRDRASAHGKLEKIRARQYSLGLSFSELATRKDSLVSTLSAEGVKLEDLERAASEATSRVSQLQMLTIETRSRVEQAASQISHLHELRQEMTNTIATKRAQIREAEQQIEDATGRIAELEQQLKRTFDERSTVSSEQAQLREQQADIMQAVDAAEAELKTLRSSREEVSQQRHDLEIRLTTLASEAASVAERVRDEYGLDIMTIAVNRPDDSMTDEQARRHLVEQKEKLKSFGAVNLLALEEYEEASERERFLNEQLGDLRTARDDLKSTINKINHTARVLFTETFEKARANFKKLFVELFSGGEADIRLVDPDDPLESAVDIFARPRGKKVLSITMMSGGERALTAIALLFSLYLVKPSPFCILDEIDAPLDDANCRRFLRILRTFSAQTQFIIITHNKITMEAADNLYGVTMEQPGISQLVAVRFNQADEDALDGAPGQLLDETAAGGASDNGDHPVSDAEATETADHSGGVAGFSGEGEGDDTDDDDSSGSTGVVPDSIAERMSGDVRVGGDSDDESLQ
jgi:chromosome segregation protein